MSETQSESKKVESRGRPVSGRLWKDVETRRASAIRTVKAKQTTWETRKRNREEQQAIKECEREMLEKRKERLALARAKREEKKARKQRNEFKNASYQVISNEQTIKSLSKKQLRMIKRTRVSKEGEVELVDAFAPTYDRKPAKRQKQR